MRVIIAGSRTITDYLLVEQAMDAALAVWAGAGIVVDEIVSGGARGVDRLGEAWARRHGIPVKRFPADWLEHGLRAGPIRNAAMAEYADALVAVYDGQSRGTANMIQEMRRRQKLYYALPAGGPGRRLGEGAP